MDHCIKLLNHHVKVYENSSLKFDEKEMIKNQERVNEMRGLIKFLEKHGRATQKWIMENVDEIEL